VSESTLESPRANPFRFGMRLAFAFSAHNAENGSMPVAQGYRRTATHKVMASKFFVRC
jgi:hypothetical protein